MRTRCKPLPDAEHGQQWDGLDRPGGGRQGVPVGGGGGQARPLITAEAVMLRTEGYVQLYPNVTDTIYSLLIIRHFVTKTTSLSNLHTSQLC